MIIFLDIDGVLNNRASILAKKQNTGTSLFALDENCIRRLAFLVGCCHPTQPQIILSSTWRLYEDNVLILEKAMSKFGLKISGRTPSGPALRNRGEEIRAWLIDNPRFQASKMLILDDDSDMLPEQLPFFVQTSMETGLTQDHVEKAARILGVSLS